MVARNQCLDVTRALHAWLFTLGFLASTVTAQAESSTVPVAEVQAAPPGYREAVEHALAELRVGNFLEARAMFAHAHALMPSAKTLRGLGLAEFELRSYAESSDHLKQALESQVRPLSPDQRQETEALLERAQHYVTRISLRVAPLTAEVVLDGTPLVGDRGAIMVSTGDHLIEVSAPDYAAQRRVVHAVGGDTQEVVIELLPMRLPVKAPTVVPPAEEARPRRLRSNPWLWAGVGVVVAGAALTVGLLAARDRDAPPYGGRTGTSLQGL